MGNAKLRAQNMYTVPRGSGCAGPGGGLYTEIGGCPYFLPIFSFFSGGLSEMALHRLFTRNRAIKMSVKDSHRKKAGQGARGRKGWPTLISFCLQSLESSGISQKEPSRCAIFEGGPDECNISA